MTLEKIIYALLGNPDTKKINRYKKVLQKIRQKQEDFRQLELSDIQKMTQELKDRFKWLNYKNQDDSKKILSLFPEIIEEAGWLWLRACDLLYGTSHILSSEKEIVWNMKPYDVQIIGWLAIHEWHVAEMKTGEGKTLVATFPAYLNALVWNGVHIVTVNDYLARRDAEEMGILYKALWLTVGIITHGQSREEKRNNYACDIIYATNNELGFDYLRDNMASETKNQSMKQRFFAIIDEVDSILIDEARTPLIISMPDNEPTQKYMVFSAMAKKLEPGHDYKIDEKQKTATLTEVGIEKLEKLLGIENIYVSERYNDIHHIENALRAQSVYMKDKDYIVVQEEVLIVDEHTGRVLPGRRYSDGLHQALEAKEGVKIQQESKTLASITFQNYFRMYWKLAWMTGTAKTEEEEFYKVYGLETLVIPTNKPIARVDKADLLFKNEKGKFEYVISYIQELHKSGQPILVGTVSVEKSEYLSQELQKVWVPHNVLNAKQHEMEAEIVANAGQKWAVTIATNMAGRGTDIKLWEWVRELWGLIILGTEKHETRRIDNQLRGRAGRQWDPGITQFLISPNDDIMRIFGGDKLFWVFNSPMFASLPDNEPLTQSKMLTRRVTGVQKQVEWHHFDARKHVLEYDDVLNKHRDIIYTRRQKVLESSENREVLKTMVQEIIYSKVQSLVIAEEIKNGKEKSNEVIIHKVHDFLGRNIVTDLLEMQDAMQTKGSILANYIADRAVEELEIIQKEIQNEDLFFEILKRILLQSFDKLWMNHIDGMSKLREQVAFVGYAQKQPLMVYKEEAFKKFENLMGEIELKVVKSVFAVKQATQIEVKAIDDTKLEVHSSDVEDMKMWEWIVTDTLEKNPLFVHPQEEKKKKIRV